MPRANRIYAEGLVWHLTLRCHKKEFLLRFARDRRRWRHWLFVAQRRYGLCVLNFIVTCNHIHLLVLDQGRGEIAKSMQLVAGRTAQEYNRRKRRRGAYWEDRYHATAVQSGEHLFRCLTYIDLNMVRAGVVRHPSEWRFSAYHEILEPPQRKAVIDVEQLIRLTGHASIQALLGSRRRAIDEQLGLSQRDSTWSSAAAVGDPEFLMKVKSRLGPAGLHRNIADWQHGACLKDDDARYSVIVKAKQAD